MLRVTAARPAALIAHLLLLTLFGAAPNGPASVAQTLLGGPP